MAGYEIVIVGGSRTGLIAGLPPSFMWEGTLAAANIRNNCVCHIIATVGDSAMATMSAFRYLHEQG